MTTTREPAGGELERWLDAYEAACSAGGAQGIACPGCASPSLDLVFVTFGSSGFSVMPAFWCSGCLRGLLPSRASLPSWASAVPWEAAGIPQYAMVPER
jgi:hypothetical protein